MLKKNIKKLIVIPINETNYIITFYSKFVFILFTSLDMTNFLTAHFKCKLKI